MRFFAVIFFTLQVIAVAKSVEWTLHKSCYEDNKLREAMTSGMGLIVSRASAVVSRLPETTGTSAIRSKNRKLKKAAQILLGDSQYSEKVEYTVEKFKLLATLKGPVGADGPQGKQYMDSEAWKKIEGQKESYLNFVIYCAPDVVMLDDGTYYSPGRKKTVSANDARVIMYNEEKAREWLSPAQKIKAVATTDVISEDDPSKLNAFLRSDRSKIPETITFHPLWLKTTSERNLVLLSDNLVNRVTGPAALKALEDLDITPMDVLLTWDGILNHELFHLHAFGCLEDHDIPSQWNHNIAAKNKNYKIPNVLAFLSTVVSLVDRDKGGYTIAQSGEITGPS